MGALRMLIQLLAGKMKCPHHSKTSRCRPQHLLVDFVLETKILFNLLSDVVDPTGNVTKQTSLCQKKSRDREYPPKQADSQTDSSGIEIGLGIPSTRMQVTVKYNV